MIVQQVVNGRPATITYFRSDWTPADEQDADWARVSYDDDGSAGVFAIEHPPTPVDKIWDPSKHPRVPSGSTGGQFVGTGSAGEAVLSAVETELGAASMAQVAPADFTRNTPPAEPGYAYHATNSYNLADIQDAGKLQTFKPSHGTDQDVWPDGSTQKRSYWTANPETGKSFYPEGGTPTLLRTNLAASQIKRESGTPDLYAAKPIPAERLEYWAEDSQWHPVASAGSGGQRKITNAKGVKIDPPREFFRGTNPGDQQRIKTGADEWDSYLFVGDNPDDARNYGSAIETIQASPDAKIIYEGTTPWTKIVGKWRKDENMLQYADRAAKAARAAGFDAAWFKRQGDIGTAIFNPTAFVRNVKKASAPAFDRSLYVHRELLNPDDVRAWAKEQAFTSTLEPADMHVTVAFSKEPVDWSTFEPDEGDLIVPTTTDAAARSIRALGPEGKAIVLSFASPDLEERWQEFCDGGCSWDYPEYRPHVTLTYSGAPLDLRSIRPYMGELRFGPERFDPINDKVASGIKESVTKALAQLFAGLTGILKGDPGASDMHVDQPMGSDKPRRRRKPAVMDDEDEPMMQAQMIAKSDDESRLVFGWASVISKNGEPVVDTQEDVITPAELLKSTTEFMTNVRYAAEMHPRDENQNFTADMAKGQVVHSFPLTADIAKALGIQTDREGWIVGVKVHDDDVWKRVKDGTLKGFSIGASALRVPL